MKQLRSYICKKKSLLMLLFLLGAGSVPAQDFKAELELVFEKFKQSRGLVYDLKVSSYATKDAAAEIQMLHFEQCGTDCYYRNDMMELFVNKHISVMINKEAKVVLWAKTDVEQLSRKDLISVSMDSVFIAMDSLVYLGEANGIKTYDVYSTQRYISRTRYCIDNATHQFTEIIYFYNSKNQSGIYKSAISFERLTLSTTDITLSKSQSDFLQVTNGSAKKAAAYSSYELIYVDNEKLY